MTWFGHVPWTFLTFRINAILSNCLLYSVHLIILRPCLFIAFPGTLTDLVPTPSSSPPPSSLLTAAYRDRVTTTATAATTATTAAADRGAADTTAHDTPAPPQWQGQESAWSDHLTWDPGMMVGIC